MTELGISILDLQDTLHKEPNTIMSSYNYRTTPINQRTKKILVGTTAAARRHELVAFFKNLLLPETSRKLVLVGHAVKAEILILHVRGIDLPMVKAVAYILDTSSIGFEIFGRSLSLSDLTKSLGIKGARHFHNAGNDANFTHRTMLLLATRGVPIIDESQRLRVEKYEQIAHSPF